VHALSAAGATIVINDFRRDDEAEDLAASVDLSMVRVVQGQVRRPLPSLEEAKAHVYTPAEEAIRRQNRSRYLVGGVAHVHERISDMAEACQADEVMITTMVHAHAARRRSYELLAKAFGIGG
jgi:alkanesulfonate monooxygenase SsuD/methylene tetrahydromethanopterin reductase-like flavin-dependent oxidoreductase (luciferase family)